MSNKRKYSIEEGMSVAKQASDDIEEWLQSLEDTTIDVENVEDDPRFQEKDIDLIWTTKKKILYRNKR